ncbi:DNA primase [Aeoliella sp. ICT_H6.2]|uniref:DNA primase n=1 Tax=Aeoliella straminimaris TaxID=2954799 RepID=A0A9X2FC71_9BACT|nr:DNA primase [Aeoliella straminimaris]MCO6045909.1 DNA primase [Aeoliella straminimaris]
MMAEHASYGFRILGSCAGERRLVDWPAALAGYAECDERAEVDREGYLSAFTYPIEFRDYLTTHRTTKGYSGPCGGDWLWWDIDADCDLERATSHARRLCAGLVERYDIDGDTLLVFFSGAKGYHVGLPLSLCSTPSASTAFHQVAKYLAIHLAESMNVAIDVGVYDRVRAFRAPNSRHPRTGLHKRHLTLDELLGMKLDAVLRLAKAPEPFDLPDNPPANDRLVADWQTAAEAVEYEAAALAERRAALRASGGADATLNRVTLEFIRAGATHGDRHRLLFSAAANLAEFGCPAPLALALLTESALDSGLTPSDVRRQIECGLDAAGGAV